MSAWSNAQNIAIAGSGYVGLSNSVLLSQHNEVVALDIVADKVDMINRKQSQVSFFDIAIGSGLVVSVTFVVTILVEAMAGMQSFV